MSSHKNIQHELKRLESDLPLSTNPAFSVPEGYFEGLASSILAKVKSSEASAQTELLELSPLLAGIPKIMPYSVPLFYFEQNAALAADSSEEPQLSFLDGVGKKLPYKIPEGYFGDLPEQILAKVGLPAAKVVPLLARKWMRMAVAAVVGGALLVGGYQYFNDKPQTNLARSSGDNTKNLVAQNAPAIEQEIKKASTKELSEFIKTVATSAKALKAETMTADKDNVKKFFKDVSDTEMETFLSVLPKADDDLTATD
jgi:hypothetical protein